MFYNTLYLLNRTLLFNMDILSDVLGKIKLKSAIYFKSDFSSSWGMTISKGPFAQFHIVTRGKCVVNFKNQSIQLFAGDIIVFPLGREHWLADDTKSELKNGQEVVQSVLNGNSIFSGQDIATTLICGHFDFDRSFNHAFIKELPEIIHIKNTERNELTWLKNITDLVIQETGSERIGSNAIVNKLGEILFIHILRAYIVLNKKENGFIASFQEEKISKSLKAIHKSPEKNWQLATLAQEAGMSRTAFSNKFKELLGDTPIEYVTQWRVLTAKELLKETDLSIGQVCENVGYKSEAAFNRLFKRKVGITPLKFRQAD